MITPRNATKDLWNAAALERHCRSSGNQKYIIDAEDCIKDSGTTPSKQEKLAIASLKDDATKNLKMRVELAVGMKAMVVLNIATEADLANSTCGTIKGIVLDPREELSSLDEDGHVHLQYPPAVVYFQPDLGTNTTFDGVPPGIIPISPSMIRFNIEVNGAKVKLREGS